MTKIFFATPTYDGKVHAPYLLSLSNTGLLLERAAIPFHIQINIGGSLIVCERNNLIHQFMKSDCTHLFFIDSDLGWSPRSVLEFIKFDKDFIAGIYPDRVMKNFTFRPIFNENGSVVVREGLIESEYVPAGFMMIRRNVIEKMYEFYKDLHYTSDDEYFPSGVALFNTEIFENRFWGEDFVFCRRVRNAGFKILVDPMVMFDHRGVKGVLHDLLDYGDNLSQ